MLWFYILPCVLHCRYSVAASATKLVSKSLPKGKHVYDRLFYLSHCDISLFLKAKSSNSSYAALLGLFSSFLKLTHRIGTAQVALVTALPCLVTFFGSPHSF